ncbi:MAG: hypothetical protein V2B18_17120 [Pseudomonadota bacterium]
MSDSSIMAKYRLSPVGLRSLFSKLTQVGALDDRGSCGSDTSGKRIPVKEILVDIRAGLNADELMIRHGLSCDALEFVFRKLVDLRFIESHRLPILEVGLRTPSGYAEFRELERHVVRFETLVCDAAKPELQGKLRDVNIAGVGLVGLRSQVSETRSFVVLGDTSGGICPFQFQAVCRWFRIEQDTGLWRAGFLITDISEDALHEMGELIRLAVIGNG